MRAKEAMLKFEEFPEAQDWQNKGWKLMFKRREQQGMDHENEVQQSEQCKDARLKDGSVLESHSPRLQTRLDV